MFRTFRGFSVVMLILIGSGSSNAKQNTALFDSHEHHLKTHSNTLLGRRTYADTINNALRQVHAASNRNSTTPITQNVDFLKDVTYFKSTVELGKRFSQRLKIEWLTALNDVLQEVRDKTDGLEDTKDNNPFCVNDTGRIVTGIFDREPWALQILDSIGKPSASITQGRTLWVGNYEQCRSVYVASDPNRYSSGFKGAYVNQELYITAGSLKGARVNWGLCFPNTCNEGQIYTLLKDVKTALGSKDIAIGKPSILENTREFTTATYASVIILSVIGALMAIGTLYDVIMVQIPRWEAEKIAKVKASKLPTNAKLEESNGYQAIMESKQNEGRDEASPPIGKPKTPAKVHHSKPIKALLAFSVYTNVSKFLNTSQPQGSLGAIHGIRFLSMSWVLLGHTFGFGTEYFANFGTFYFNNVMKDWTYDAIMNAFSSVDSFFTLSGFLTAYLTIREMNKIKTWKINWGLFYFHRYWRLTPPYMLTLTLALGLSQYLGSGPMWPNVVPSDRESCEDKWWANLLYVNNAVNDAWCFGHAWYLANDMQFFVLSPLMIVPFFFNIYAGLAMSSLFLMTNWIVSGVMSSDQGWDARPGEDQDYMIDYYMKPWHRIGPYVVGIIVGALLGARKLPRLNKLSNTIGWMLATATGLAVVYGLRGDISGKHQGSVAVHALYNALSRSAWGACVCWVIVACSQGYGGPVNSLLSWSPFVCLGRLTYMAYLVHPNILYAYYANMGEPFMVNDFNMIVLYLGVVFLVNMVAFVLMLGLESPMIGLEKALLPERKRD